MFCILEVFYLNVPFTKFSETLMYLDDIFETLTDLSVALSLSGYSISVLSRMVNYMVVMPEVRSFIHSAFF